MPRVITRTIRSHNGWSVETSEFYGLPCLRVESVYGRRAGVRTFEVATFLETFKTAMESFFVWNRPTVP